MSEPTVTLRDTGQTLSARDYLCGVVPAEMPASWPEAALRAQCVAAASYAASKSWVVYSDARDQAYNATRRTAKTDAIVDDMLGIVLWHVDQASLPPAERGKPARAYYSAYCGGEHKRDWGPHLRAGRCYCAADTQPIQRRWYEQNGGGHKQGLCQQGARALAARGYTWDQILSWYYDLGDSLELRTDWGAQRLWAPPTPPANRITLHIQRRDYPRWLTDSMARLAGRVEYVVCIDPPMESNPFSAQRVLARIWTGGDANEQALIDRGREGAEAYWREIAGKAPAYVYAILGPNEPIIETAKARANLVTFYRRLCDLAHAEGRRIAGPNTGVGRLGNDEALTAAGWGWLDTMRVVAHELEPLYRAVDVATDHAYGRRSGAAWTGWTDWTLRQRLLIRHLPYDLQRDLVWVCTEGGLDIAGGEFDGWLGRSGPREEQYAQQILEANRALSPQVRGYALYTALPEARWRSFEVTEGLWRRLETAILTMPGQAPADSGDLYALAQTSRWQQEEALREIERGDVSAAKTRLGDNIKRGYALETALKGR